VTTKFPGKPAATSQNQPPSYINRPNAVGIDKLATQYRRQFRVQFFLRHHSLARIVYLGIAAVLLAFETAEVIPSEL
jgi:hypothetical protein